MRVPFAFLFCTIVGLKKLEMGASIHRPIFARGPAHYSAEEKRYYSTYTLRTYFFTYTTARRRWFPPLVCGHYRHFLRLGHCALCVVAAANDTVHVGGEKERGILRIVQEKNEIFQKIKVQSTLGEFYKHTHHWAKNPTSFQGVFHV